MTFPTVTVEVAFVSDPLDDTPTYTDITDKVFAISTSIGRARQFDSFEPGTASFTLDNADRDFDPLHDTGPYFSNLRPNKRVRVQAAYDGTTYELFNGHVDGWPQQYADQHLSVSEIGATDALKLLNRTPLPVDQYAEEVLADTPRLWYRLGETSGKELIDSSGNDRHALGQIDMSNVTADGLLPCSTDGGINLDSAQWDARIPKEHLAFDYDPCTVEFWFRADKPPSDVFAMVATSAEPGLYAELLVSAENGIPGYAGVIYFTVGDRLDIGTVNGLRTVRGSFVCDGVPHHIACTRSGSTLRLYVDGVNVTNAATSSGSFVATVGGPLDINVNFFSSYGYDKWEGAQGPSMDEFAIYDTALSQARIQAHYQAGALLWNGDRAGERVTNVLDAVSWPAALTDIDTGQAILGPATWDKDATVLEYLRLVEATEQGQLFIDHTNAGVVRFRDRYTVLNDFRTRTRQAWFSDDDTDVEIVHYEDPVMLYDDTEIVNRVNVEWVGGTVTAFDQTSIDESGEQSRTITTLATSKADAESLATWALDHTKDAFLRIESVTVTPSSMSGGYADLAWEAVLGLQIGDWVLFERWPQGIGSPISVDLLVEGIEHNISDGVNWSTTFRFGPKDPLSYWVLDDSELDTGTRLAF